MNRYTFTGIILFFIAMIASFTMNAHAAEKLPYEYTFEKDVGANFNGIEGVKTINMTFHDKTLSATDISMNNNIYVLYGADKVNILKPAVVSGNTVTFSFKNLEFLDYSQGALQDYKIVIEKDAKLHFDQLQDYEIPFNIYEVLPGFESIFVKSSTELINNKILKHNAAIDVAIHVPKMYLTEIKTTHRYKGIADQTNPNLESHSLTNIDVLTDPEASRLTVSVNDEDQYARDLDYRADTKGFSMGIAGLEALICETEGVCTGSAKDFHLTAFNSYGKVLSKRNFKIKVVNPSKDFIVSNYLKKPDKIFGQQTTLLALMNDPKLLESIVTQIPVTELDRLGVTYSLGGTVEVINHEQLTMALDNPTIKTIALTAPIMEDVEITRDVIIDGAGNALNGNVTLGSGANIIARLKNTTVSKDLLVDVGPKGSAILEGTDINGFATVKSGAVHLFDVNALNGFELDNQTDMRMVSVNSTPNITMTSNQEVTFIGTYGEITVTNADAKMTIRSNTDIAKITVEAGAELTLTKPRDKAIPEGSTGEIVVIDTDPLEGDSGQTVSEWYYPEMLSQTIGAWEEIGVRPTLDKFPRDVEWKVLNPNVFGTRSKIVFNDGLLQIVDVYAKQIQEVILQGTHEGKVYRVTILVEVDIQ